MTRKEKEEKLLDALGLKLGDIIEVDECNGRHQYTIDEDYDCFALLEFSDKETQTRILFPIWRLLIIDFRKVEKPRKWKDIKCNENFTCLECPILNACTYSSSRDKIETLQEALDNAKKVGLIDEEEYGFYQKRIDKEYKEKSTRRQSKNENKSRNS